MLPACLLSEKKACSQTTRCWHVIIVEEPTDITVWCQNQKKQSTRVDTSAVDYGDSNLNDTEIACD